MYANECTSIGFITMNHIFAPIQSNTSQIDSESLEIHWNFRNENDSHLINTKEYSETIGIIMIQLTLKPHYVTTHPHTVIFFFSIFFPIPPIPNRSAISMYRKEALKIGNFWLDLTEMERKKKMLTHFLERKYFKSNVTPNKIPKTTMRPIRCGWLFHFSFSFCFFLLHSSF